MLHHGGAKKVNKTKINSFVQQPPPPQHNPYLIVGDRQHCEKLEQNNAEHQLRVSDNHTETNEPNPKHMIHTCYTHA